MKAKTIFLSAALVGLGILAGAFLVDYDNRKTEKYNRNADLAFSRVKEKGEDFSREVPPILRTDRRYAAALDECQSTALMVVRRVEDIDADRPLREFEVIGSERAFDDGSILLIDVTTSTGLRGLYGCLVDEDLEVTNGKFLYSWR